MFFTTVNNLEDQEDLLQNILETKNRIRTQREKKRLEKEKLNVKYGMLMNPVTKHLESILKKPESIKPPDPPVLPEEPKESELNEPTQLEETTASNSSDILQPITNEEEISDYQKALDSIEDENLDDHGLLGINPNTKLIHDMPFSVDGNDLLVTTKDGDVRIPKIKPDTWKILLAKDPGQLNVALYQKNTKALPSPAFRQYRNIVNKLDLLKQTNEKIAEDERLKKNITERNKYKI